MTKRIGFPCRQNNGHWAIRAVAALGLMWVGQTAIADQIIFTIDPSQSSETWSGNDGTFGAFQGQSSGSLNPSVGGNFVVSFDPSSDAPTTIQFAPNSPSGGFFQLLNSTSSANPFGTPASVAGTAGSGGVQFAIRNDSWNFSSAPLNASSSTALSSTFTAATTNFTVLSGTNDWQTAAGTTSQTYAGFQDHVTAGTWTLSQSASASGNWTLTLNGSYGPYPYNSGIGGYTPATYRSTPVAGFTLGNLSIAGTFVATAQYSVAGSDSNVTTGNVATVPPPNDAPVSAQVLGGSGTIGGVTANFDSNITSGTLSVQQVPGLSSLSQAAVAAAQVNPEFLLSTSDQSIGSPQIWNVQFGGSLNGGLATLVFDYDPSSLPPGTNQSLLGIWHFDESLGQWVFGGTVSPIAL